MEREADRIRAQFFGSLIEAYNRIAFATPEVAETILSAHAAEQREWYARHRQQEVARHLNWKAANPARISEYGRTRLEREREGADGTATIEAIAELKRATTHCAYCGSQLVRKQTDHMHPVGLGGEHSLRNIVIVCPDCNARKATLSYEKWIDRVAPQHRARVASLHVERYGQVAAWCQAPDDSWVLKPKAKSAAWNVAQFNQLERFFEVVTRRCHPGGHLDADVCC